MLQVEGEFQGRKKVYSHKKNNNIKQTQQSYVKAMHISMFKLKDLLLNLVTSINSVWLFYLTSVMFWYPYPYWQIKLKWYYATIGSAFPGKYTEKKCSRNPSQNLSKLKWTVSSACP